MANDRKLNEYAANTTLHAHQLNNDNTYFKEAMEALDEQTTSLNANKLNGLVYPGESADTEIDVYRTNATTGYVTFLVLGGNQSGEGVYSVHAMLQSGEITLTYTSLDDSIDIRSDVEDASAKYNALTIGYHNSDDGGYKHICINRQANSSDIKVVEIANSGFEAIDPADSKHDPQDDNFTAGYCNTTLMSYGKEITSSLSLNNIIENGIYNIASSELNNNVTDAPTDFTSGAEIAGMLYVFRSGNRVYQTFIYTGTNGYSVKSRYTSDIDNYAFSTWENMLSPIIKYTKSISGSKVLTITTNSKFN